MNVELEAAVLGAAILSGFSGFMTCALFASRRIREEREESYWDGYGACNRDHLQKPKIYQAAMTAERDPINTQSIITDGQAS